MMLKLLKPLEGAPDEPVHNVAVLASLACCPGMSPIGGGAEPDHLQALEAAIVQHAAETDGDAYRDVHDKIPSAARNTLLLLLWILYQARLEEAQFKLPGDLDERCEVASKVAVRVRCGGRLVGCGVARVCVCVSLRHACSLRPPAPRLTPPHLPFSIVEPLPPASVLQKGEKAARTLRSVSSCFPARPLARPPELLH
jgi:type IV pilus biogenesis protein CpaD/CtpE